MAARPRQQGFPLENISDKAFCIKHISDCLFVSFYLSIDARTQLFSGIFWPARFSRFVRLYFQRCGFRSMKKVVFLSIALFVFLGLASAQSSQKSQPPAQKQELSQTQIMKVDDVRPGMKGTGYTV